MTNTPNPFPLESFENQNLIFARAFSILEDAIANRSFPGASIAVTCSGKLLALKSFGHFIYRETQNAKDAYERSVGGGSSRTITVQTLFDLASLTKVVATTPMAMLLYDRGQVDLDAPVAAIVPEFLTQAAHDSRRKGVTLRMLLSHSSGLPAYEKLFLEAKTRDELLGAALAMPLVTDPATTAAYSDIGFMILGIALERIADEPLDRFCQRELFAPLSMIHSSFNPPKELRNNIPPTADDRTFRHRLIQGEVQDENASVLGGVAPHAGLFSTAEDLARYANALLSCAGDFACGVPVSQPSVKAAQGDAALASSLFRPETIHLFTRRESTPAGTSRALGWDTPSGSPSQSGAYLSSNSFGHLGYTGTSLWIDPRRQLSITLLTNRTWPDCSNHAIKIVRPKFHDAIVEAIDKMTRR